MKKRGRLAAFFILLAVAVLVGSTHSSATSGGPLPADATGANASSEVTARADSNDASSLAATPFASNLKTGEAEREGKEKRASKGGRSSGPSKTVRGGRSKAARRSAKGSKQDTTPQTQASQGAESRITRHSNALGQTVYSVSSAGFDISPPLTQLAVPAQEDTTGAQAQLDELELPSWRVPRSNKRDPVTQVAPSADRFGSSASLPFPTLAPSTGFNFAGMAGSQLGGYPPDNNGSVGNDQFVETVNTRYQVWTLNRGTNTVTSLAGPSSINTLWTGFVGACSTRNDGDPVVLYDKIANRWVITQFTSTAVAGVYYQCVAVSTTPNAAGTYYRYAFAMPDGNFGDYPHYGVWSDGYYMMAHAFTASSGGSYVAGIFAAMDRTKMLAGDSTATWQVIKDPTEGGHMPADIDGYTPPPGGAPGIFTSIHSNGMYLYRMKVDFATPANTTRTLQAVMPIAASTGACASAVTAGTCIPQPGSTALVDSLGDRLMFRLAYRNFIDHESLVVSHSVDPGITGLVSGVRWYDFRISGQPGGGCSSYPCTYQQGTIADVANGRSRWMPSISMDSAENIIVGYSTTGKTSGSDNHSIRYTGRAKNDPLGTMTAPETILATGTRNITSTTNTPGRWGDYTSTSIDPADDCTFWHVNEFYTSGNTGNGNWKTQVSSVRYPAGTGAGQCQASTCTNRPTSAPVIGSAGAIADNQIQVTWTGITPQPGSYAIERAIGFVGSEGLYQPVGFVPGSANNFVDTTVQGGLTYTYRVIAATDASGKCQALVRSGGTSATASGACNIKPVFAGATSASSGGDANSCSVTINWTPATSSCPLTPNMRYNVFRGTVPDFTPSVSNRIASCVTGPSSYVDTNGLVSGNTYYYVVRAEDDSTGNGGECGGGNEESNSVVVAGTAYGTGLSSTPGTWTDGGGDSTSFLTLNPGGGGNTADQTWRIVKTANDAGANHTPGGAYAYRTAGPAATSTYSSNECSVAETPTLTAGSTTINLTYWERHQLEKGWDGVAIEYSRNGGAWTDLPAPSNSTANGCLVTDLTTDYATLGCTGTPPSNACGYATTKSVITGPVGSGTSCTNWTTGSTTSYGRRCHLITGLTAGDTIKFRWRMISDPGSEFAGFYLDDIAVTNILLPQACTTNLGPPTTLTADPATGTFGGTTTLSATLTDGTNPLSGRSIAFTLNGVSKGSATTNGSGVATVSNVSLSGINAGSYPTGVGASFAGGGGFSGSSNTAALTVNQASQTITFGALGGKTYGDSDFSVSASASSGLAVSFAAAGNCSVTGTTVHITGAGSCTITASQSGNTNYSAAPNVDQSFSIAQASTTTVVTVSNAAYDGNPHGGTATVTGAGGLNQSVTVSYSGRNATTYGPSTTAPTAAGDYTASANYAGDSNYTSSSDSKDYSITKVNQTITFGALSDKVYGDADFTVSATASSGLAVSFAASGACTVTGDSVHITGVGSCTITASQGGDSNYNAAADVPRSFNIGKGTATVSLSNLSYTYDGTPRSATATTTPNGLSVSITYDGSATAPTNAGSYSVVATITDANYQGTASDTLVISKATASISVTGYTGVYDGNSHGATGTATGVQSEDLSGLLHLGSSYMNVPGGTANWTFDGGNNYNSANGSVEIAISKATAVITWSNPADITYGTALSGTQLNATASTAGSFLYTPASGTVLPAGNNQNLHVDFTPSDTTNYQGASKDVSINVLAPSLSITKVAQTTDPTELGKIFPYVITVTNSGSASATSVVVTDALASSLTYNTVSTSQGSCTFTAGNNTVTCQLGSIAANTSASITLKVKPRQEGAISNTASYTSTSAGVNAGNATTQINVIKTADLKVTKVDSADPIYVGEQTTYTMKVTNLGPVNAASAVMLTDSLPAGMVFMSATTSQGTLITPAIDSGGIVTADLGSLGVNVTATVTVTVKATQAGTITNTSSATGNESDPNTANNTASQVTTVLTPVTLQKVLLSNQSPVGGCTPYPTGQVYLTTPAPVGGVTVNLSSTNAGATVPASVFIAAGQTKSDPFTVTTVVVPKRQDGNIAATLPGSNTVTRNLQVYAGTCPQ